MRRWTSSIIIALTLLFTLVLVPAVGAVSAPVRYAALGDSVAAGAGLPGVSGATAEDVACGRSSQAYPFQVAYTLNLSLTQLACGGAKVDEGIYGPQSVNDITIPSQLPRAFAAARPDIMTITIGANDARWTQFVRECYLIRCGGRIDEARAKIYRADLRIELAWMLHRIDQLSAGNPPRVLLSGYYTPLSTSSCLPDRVTATEQAWLTEQTADLNQAIRSVIPYFSFAEYVPVDFSGHGICSSDSWVQGIDDPAPFHPTAAGQTAIAQAFVTQIQR